MYPFSQMQPSAIMFHWTACIGFVQSLFLAVVDPPTLMRAVYTGSTLTSMYYYGLSAQLHEPSRQTMRLYVPDDEQYTVRLARVAKWSSRGLHLIVIMMDVAYIVVVTEYNVWLCMLMFIACGFSPAMKLLRQFAPEINTTVAQHLSNNHGHNGHSGHNGNDARTPVHADYSLLDDSDHRDAVQQRFMMKQVPRMLAMIALAACHMALMLDVRDACFSIPRNSTTILKRMC